MSTPHTDVLQRRLTAYHEAGHAVIALRCGMRLGGVALCSSGPALGITYCWADPQAGVPGDSAGENGLMQELVDAEHTAMVLLAGPLTEARLLRKPLPTNGNESDLQRCFEICTSIIEIRHLRAERTCSCGPSQTTEQYANRLRRRVLAMLAQPSIWRDICALAHDLVGWSRLNGDEAAETVQLSRHPREQLLLSLRGFGTPRRSTRPVVRKGNHIPHDFSPAFVRRRSFRPALVVPRTQALTVASRS